MRMAWRSFQQGLRRVWQGFREWSGDRAYEKYLECALRTGRKAPLTRAEFYVEQLTRKYSRPSRCC
jgi:uncharacterized short protein YbdD (DUF466 family)